MRISGKLATWSVILCGAAACFAQSGVIFVDEDAAPGGNGQSWQGAYRDLQTALTGTPAGTQIWVAEGTYRPTVPYPVGNGQKWWTFNIPRRVQLYGGFNGTESTVHERNPAVNLTILDGDIAGNDVAANFPNGGTYSDNVYHVVFFLGSTFPQGVTRDERKLSGFIIQNGRADLVGDVNDPNDPNASMGGGILTKTGDVAVKVAAPMLEQLVLINNFAAREGGAIRLAGGASTPVVNCRFEYNFVEGGKQFAVAGGAGLSALGGASSTNPIQNCIFFDNHVETGQGGGALGYLNFHNCTFVGNTSSLDAAAFSCSGAGIGSMTNCIVWGHGTTLPVITGRVRFSVIEGQFPLQSPTGGFP